MRGAALAAALLAGCAAQTPEPITLELWAQAGREATRLSGKFTLADARETAIVQIGIDEIEARYGVRPHACLHDGAEATLYCRPDRPWQSDRVHHLGILIHEWMHTAQPDWMSRGCREIEAHAVQVAWLLEHGATERAAAVAENAQQYECNVEMRTMEAF